MQWVEPHVFSSIRERLFRKPLTKYYSTDLLLVVFFSIHHHFEKTCVILFAGNLGQIVGLIRSWGFAAPLMSLLLMILQAIVAPLPAFLVTAANGMVFGNFWGAFLSWTGALMGALTSFYIARLFGNVAAEKIIRNQKVVEFIRRAGEKRGFYVILLSRLLPFISFDLISYMAGLSGIRPWAFILGHSDWHASRHAYLYVIWK